MVSIIIPVYNGEKYISNALNSCINQTYNELEIIVVNDGSTDKTAEITKKIMMNNGRIRLIEQENAGVCCARNKGIENAKGEWILFLDADDELLPNAIEMLLSIGTCHKADMVVGGHIALSMRGEDCPIEDVGQVIIWEHKVGLEKYLIDSPELYSACGKLYKNSFIKQIRFREGHKVHEDSFFNFLCCLQEPKIAITEKVYYKVFLSKDSASRSFFTKQKYEDILYFTEEKKRIISEFFPEYLNKVYNVVIKSRFVFLWNTIARFDEAAKVIQKEAKRTVKQYAKYFVPATKQDKKMFLLIKYNLYEIYSIIKKVKEFLVDRLTLKMR